MNKRSVHIVLMGVAGTGKTTIGEGVAERFGLVFAEGDDFHSDANRAKMGEGHPLNDEDRWPWLRSLRDWMSAQAADGKSTVVACSALREVYRDILREAEGDVYFVHLQLPEELNGERLTRRQGHYMATDMLVSQLATLEPLTKAEDGATVTNVGEPSEVVEKVCAVVADFFQNRMEASEADSS